MNDKIQFDQNKNKFASTNTLEKLNEETLSFKLSLRKKRVDNFLMKRRFENLSQSLSNNPSVVSLSNDIITNNEVCFLLRKALSSDQVLLNNILQTLLEYIQRNKDNINNRNLVINNDELISLLYQTFMSNLSSPLTTFLVTSIFLSLTYISQKITEMLLTSNVLNFIVDFAIPKIECDSKILTNIVSFIGNSLLDHFSLDIISILFNTNYISSLSNILSSLIVKQFHSQFDLTLITSIVWNFYLIFNNYQNIPNYSQMNSSLISTIVNQLLLLIPIYKTKIENLDDFQVLLSVLFSFSKIEQYAMTLLVNNGINVISSLFEYIYLENNSQVIILDNETIYLSLLTISNLFNMSDNDIAAHYDKCITNVLSVLIKRHRIFNTNDLCVKEAILTLLGNIASQSSISDVRSFFINDSNIKLLIKYYTHKQIIKDFLFIIENIFFVHDIEVINAYISNDIFTVINNSLLTLNEEIVKEALNALSFAVEADKRFHSNFIVKSMARSAIDDSLRKLLTQIANEELVKKIEYIIKEIENVN